MEESELPPKSWQPEAANTPAWKGTSIYFSPRGASGKNKVSCEYCAAAQGSTVTRMQGKGGGGEGGREKGGEIEGGWGGEEVNSDPNAGGGDERRMGGGGGGEKEWMLREGVGMERRG